MGFILFAVVIMRPKATRTRRSCPSYECGFNAFDDARMKFDVRFYLVSILFIIFDLEVAFLFPVGGVAVRRSSDLPMVRLLVDDDLPGRADHRLHL